MAKYRISIRQVEAQQFLAVEWKKEWRDRVYKCRNFKTKEEKFFLRTDDGSSIRIEDKDYLITSSDGTCHVVKEDRFEKEYKPNKNHPRK